MPDIFRKTLNDREEKAGTKTPEIGKSWAESFGSSASAPMSQSDFSKSDGKKKQGPPSDMLKKHDQK